MSIFKHHKPTKLQKLFIPGSIPYRSRRKLEKLCVQISDLAIHLPDVDTMSALEVALVNMVGRLDKPSRHLLFEASNRIIDARQDVQQRAIVTPKMQKIANARAGAMRVGLVAKNVTDLIIDNTNKYNINSQVKDNILKTVILRLALELNHDSIYEVAETLLPDVAKEKGVISDRNMYG